MGKPAVASTGFSLFRSLAKRQGVPTQDAEDVAQEALLRALEADQRLGVAQDPAPYRVTIALNQARNHVRDVRRQREVLTWSDEREARGECATPEELLRLRERAALTRRLIAQLDPKYQAVLIRHELEETPLAEIAAELGLSVHTVKTQHRRALEEFEAQGRRWQAQQRSRGLEEDACVPLAFGLPRRRSWTASLRRLGVKVLVQGALVMLTGALVSAMPPPPNLGSWMQPATARAPATASTAQDVTVAAPQHGTHSAASAAASTAPPVPPLTPQGSARADAVVSRTPAPSVTRAPRAASPGRADQSAVSERERSLVDQARRAVEAHTAFADVEARQLLEAHAQEFPQGQLAAERDALLRQIR
ncbi:RNA polymerase sigma factor [Sorangium cellulosum]|uniref:RNA polymerase sigma factor n=1 Tax=Sorangium cellulosum TaxID=56 RepID=UPI000CF573E4|nr:sigma-70 family RNA polymerase sigma factor [Sorangium cellulosum]